jgi:ferrochelatase
MVIRHHRKAVVLFNLGGPDNLASVRPFLKNLFSDPAIIRAPAPVRWFLSELISRRRAPIAREIYQMIGGKSPILPQTEAQRDALERELSSLGEYKVFTCMRYWHPMSDAVVREVKAYDPAEVILLPLYPQFSTTTSASSIQDWEKSAQKHRLQAPTRSLCCYPCHHGWVEAMADLILPVWLEASQHGTPRLLFSAHGLPQKIVDAGDPYAWQVEQTMQAVLRKLEKPALDARVCYQSKVGPMQWLTPSTEHEIEQAGETKTPLVVIPIAFVSEHSETLVELDIEYRELALKSGVPFYGRVPTVGTNPAFIRALAQLCTEKPSTQQCGGTGEAPICPTQYGDCYCRKA